MATTRTLYSITTILEDGDQLAASGYTSFEAVQQHINERVRMGPFTTRKPLAFFVVASCVSQVDASCASQHAVYRFSADGCTYTVEYLSSLRTSRSRAA